MYVCVHTCIHVCVYMYIHISADNRQNAICHKNYRINQKEKIYFTALHIYA